MFIMDNASPHQEVSRSARTPAFIDLIIIYILSSVLLILFGSLFQELHLLSGLIITEVVCVLGPPLAYTLWYHYDLHRTFHLAPIPIRAVQFSIIPL